MLFLIILLICIFMAGLLTLLESKLMALFQSSVSNYKFNLFGTLQFFMDFIKLLSKGLLKGYYFKSYKSLFGVFLYYFSNMLMVIIMTSTFSCSYYFMLDLFSIIVAVWVNLLVKIFCLYCLKSDFLSGYINSLKVTLMVMESFSYILDLIYILMFFLVDVNSECALSLSFNSSKQLMVMFFMLSLMKSFSNPFDNLESESEVLNNLYMSVEGMEYALWTLFEYVSIINNIIFYILIMKVSLGITMLVKIYMFMLSLILVCLLSSVCLSVKLSLLFNIVVSYNMFVLMILTVLLL